MNIYKNKINEYLNQIRLRRKFTCSSLRNLSLGESLRRGISRFNHSGSKIHRVKSTSRLNNIPSGYAASYASYIRYACLVRMIYIIYVF